MGNPGNCPEVCPRTATAPGLGYGRALNEFTPLVLQAADFSGGVRTLFNPGFAQVRSSLDII